MNDTNLVLGGKEFSSRLIVGTGKYSSMEIMKEAHEASGAEIITVALRRVSLPSGESLLDHLDTTRYTLLPNTAGCYNADEAIRTAYLAREAGLGEMVVGIEHILERQVAPGVIEGGGNVGEERAAADAMEADAGGIYVRART